jgi:hypothetical protein
LSDGIGEKSVILESEIRNSKSEFHASGVFGGRRYNALHFQAQVSPKTPTRHLGVKTTGTLLDIRIRVWWSGVSPPLVYAFLHGLRHLGQKPEEKTGTKGSSQLKLKMNTWS